MDILTFDVLDSTNNYLKEFYQKMENLSVVVAKTQTKGRGRSDRTFLSNKGGAYFSILLKPPFNFAAHELTPLAAVAVKKGIKEATKIDTKIKWVNDLIYNDKKVCGILCEAISKQNKIEAIIIGIGININRPKNGFEEFEDIATSLYKRGGKIRKIIEAVLDNFLEIYLNKEDFFVEYKDSLITIGKKVKIQKNNKVGKAIDLAKDFSLVVEYLDGEKERINVGEIVVKS